MSALLQFNKKQFPILCQPLHQVKECSLLYNQQARHQRRCTVVVYNGMNFNGTYSIPQSGILRLISALDLPEEYNCYQGTKANRTEALLILLRRLNYPNRLYDLVPLFGRSEPELSIIFNEIKQYSYINTTLHVCFCLCMLWMTCM